MTARIVPGTELIPQQSLNELSPQEQDWYLFTAGIAPLSLYGAKTLGKNALNTICNSACNDTLFEDISIHEHGFVFVPKEKNLATIERNDIAESFSKIYEAIYKYISLSLGKETAYSRLAEAYTEICKEYDTHLVARFLAVMPKGLFDKERMELLIQSEQILRQKMEQLDSTTQTLIARDKELTAANEKLTRSKQDLDRTAKTLIRRDLELTAANERLTELDRVRTEFFALVSHQLRTPLSTIKWYVGALQKKSYDELDPEKLEKYLKAVYLSNERLIGLVNSFLNVSRIELGAMMIDPTQVNVLETINTLIQDLTPRITSQSLNVSVQYAPDAPKTMSLDAKLFQIIIENFLTNAIKYTPEGGNIHVTVSKVNESFQIAVADTGYGIPKHHHAKIFTKLFRSDNITSRVQDGSGLGLFIVKSIIEQSGGTIWFESEENKGSTFYISYPLAGMKRRKGTKQLT